MRKIFTILAGSILLASLNSVYAAQVTCPSPNDIRTDGSNFKYAMFVQDWEWALISQPFHHDQKEWQTTFTLSLPSVMYSDEAVSIGASKFKNTPLMMEPVSSTLGTQTTCTYIAMSSGVMVTASTPVVWGFKKN